VLSRRATLLLALPVALALAGYVVLPLLRALVLGLDPEPMGAVFGSPAGRRALANSLGVSLATVAASAVVGTGLAWALWRYRPPGAAALRVAAAIPLALPPLVGALAFGLLYGEGGMLPRALEAALGLAPGRVGFRGIGAVLAVHVYVFNVYFYLFAGAALARLDGALLDASADLGAGGGTTLRRVVLPALRPALLGAALVVFMLSMGSLTAPLLFAGDEPFLTTQVYGYKTNGYLDRAAAVAAVLGAVCVAFLLAAERRAESAVTGAVKGPARVAPPPSGPLARVLAGLGVGLALLLLVPPVAAVDLLSFVDVPAWTTQPLPPRYTLAHYADLVRDPDVFAPLASSVWMAAVATAVAVAFGLAAALVVVKGRLPGRGLLRTAVLLPFALPGPVVALALLVAFAAPSVWTGGAVLVGTAGLLPLAYAVRHLPLAARAVQAALEAFDDRLAEASADLGAGAAATFRRVVLPVLRPAVVAGALLVFVGALGEFPASVLLYVYGNRPIAVEVLARLRQYDLGAAAAYAVLLMAVVGAAAVVAQRLSERRR
jgi:iron(III) transport system permease protein